MEEALAPKEDLMAKYKKSALLVGMFALTCFLLRMMADVVISAVVLPLAANEAPYTLIYTVNVLLSALFLQILPSVIGFFIFRYYKNSEKPLKRLYHKPKNLGKALGNTVAVYGFAQIFNILTLVIIFLINKLAGETSIDNPITSALPMSLETGLVFMLLAGIIAPVFEEFMVRGLVFGELKQYGNGLAIFVSAVFFGLLHGNLSQFFYTTAMGVALGYITYATGGILASTIIHAIVNMLSVISSLLLNTPSVQEYVMSGSTERIPDSDMFIVTLFGIYMVSLIILIIVGLVLAIIKIRQIKRYKVQKVWGEVKNRKKVKILITTVPMLICAVLILDAFTGFSSELIANFFAGLLVG